MTAPSKFITLQQLADHDGAAIFAIFIATFDEETGVVYNKELYYPSLEEQVEAERVIDATKLQKVLKGLGIQPFLIKAELASNPTFTDEQLLTHLSNGTCYFWNLGSSIGTMLSYINQRQEEDIVKLGATCYDVDSFLRGAAPPSLDSIEDVYVCVNLICQAIRQDKQPVPSIYEEPTSQS